jgi:GAF domain-containing protein
LQAPPKLSTDIKIERGSAPAAGFAESAAPDNESALSLDAGSLLAAAQLRGREIARLCRNSDTPLTVEDIFSLVSVRVKSLVHCDAMAAYCRKGDVLLPQFVSGDNFRLFSSLQIPLGEGLSGWVAQNHKAILNGNPSVEPGYLNDPKKYSTLRSALAVPIEGTSGIVAVLALYRVAQDAFTNDELLAAESLGNELGSAIEQATLKAAGAAAR